METFVSNLHLEIRYCTFENMSVGYPRLLIVTTMAWMCRGYQEPRKASEPSRTIPIAR